MTAIQVTACPPPHGDLPDHIEGDHGGDAHRHDVEAPQTALQMRDGGGDGHGVVLLMAGAVANGPVRR